MRKPAPDTIVTSRHLITTQVKVQRCARCRTFVLCGFCEGVRTVVDVFPVDEAAALDAGLWTYELWSGRLAYRADWSGVGRRGVSRGPVLADHRH